MAKFDNSRKGELAQAIEAIFDGFNSLQDGAQFGCFVVSTILAVAFAVGGLMVIYNIFN